MEKLSGKLDEESITKSIDLREQITIETNKIDSMIAQENSIDLKTKIAEQKFAVDNFKFQAQLQDLKSTFAQKAKSVPNQVTVQLAQDKDEVYKLVQELDAKLQEHAKAQLSTRKQVAESLLQSQAAEEAALQAWLT